ncbi:34ded611-1e21-4ff7-ab8f-2b65f9492e9a [Sclerotinia trifoliorum]|uniref:34ded611-1e21-4ff7-ab8f-2b65f9492e9a n=1 Tax=Sclerotinia trifoliorum TaxID=28548 RepID=A0A8H2W0U4_9HELO|nr:34ded611-1e21-4ff7-ab8f-2b65f9492e9a [Sclerotinia trifoliorum]
MPTYAPIVNELRDELLREVDDLDTAVRNALKYDIPDMVTYGIISGKGFLDFADWLVRGWIPTETTHGRDIYYILCMFYFVLAQDPLGVRQTSILPKNVGKPLTPLSDWLVRYAQEIGKFMDQPESWNETSLTSYRNSPQYRVFEAEDPKNWKTFNQFFHRKLKEPREICSPHDDHIITFPADSTFAGAFSVTDESEVILKNLPWKVSDLLGKYGKQEVPGSKDKTTYGDLFKEGVWTHCFLNTFDYHRQHAAVSGIVEVVDVIQGAAYLEVLVKTDEKAGGHNYLQPRRRISPNMKKQDPASIVTLDAPDTPGYQFLQTRGIIIINNEKLGRVALLPIGMAVVSSVVMNTELLGKTVKKGDEISHFAFGGSDIVMVFEQKARVSNFPDLEANEHFYYGEKLCKAHYKEDIPSHLKK